MLILLVFVEICGSVRMFTPHRGVKDLDKSLFFPLNFCGSRADKQPLPYYD
ncbi:hypothetical protein SAMN06296036_12146 [Pseudobacteriovorax antillogorgiicola]|uniref:Uncharacterized protein n=1 Tax=Pseudobacteriovorax antillogorgiicola TaxID=1513793 RepID=A0A1Y6CHA4_9BACT|nr:hypothetical protein EDD56_12146 [Pseudobacteriovorax antillogorgiicola]SMF62205.1 hypothetical protein SAMN06296036_12146 [Pseudobacteriovorax antillogorgiicola]